MANITSLPVEVLHIIFKYLDKVRRESSAAALIYGGSEWDRSIFQAMRVCRQWRDVVFDVYFRSDSSTWTKAIRQDNIRRLRYVDSLPERLHRSKFGQHQVHKYSHRRSGCPQITPTRETSLLAVGISMQTPTFKTQKSVKSPPSQCREKTKQNGRTWKGRSVQRLMKKCIRPIKRTNQHFRSWNFRPVR